MKKPQEFVVYPRRDDTEEIVVQSDRSVGRFNPATGEGWLNIKGSTFLTDSRLGAERFCFPTDFVEACKAVALRTDADGTIALTKLVE